MVHSADRITQDYTYIPEILSYREIKKNLRSLITKNHFFLSFFHFFFPSVSWLGHLGFL
nr:hypothetical protein Itr_chr04CG16290 [Ipomoea trifida]